MKSKPIVTAGAVVLLINTFLLMAVALGWFALTGEQLTRVNGFLIALMAIVFPAVGAWWANRNVTPLADPRAPDGEPLTRGDGSPALKARDLGRGKQ